VDQGRKVKGTFYRKEKLKERSKNSKKAGSFKTKGRNL